MPFRIRPRSIDGLIAGLGLAALVCLSPLGAGVALIAAISIIGLPIAFMLGAIPTLFLILLGARLAYLGLLRIGLESWLLAVIVALAVLAIPPALENRRLDAIAAALVAGDRNEIGRPPRIGTLAVIGRTWHEKTPPCDDLCQRALLNGAVGAVMMASGDAPAGTPEDTIEGMLYRLEERPTCPQTEIRDHVGVLKIAGEKQTWGDKTASDLMRLRIAAGTCLIAEPATLAQADAALVAGAIREGKSQSTAGLSPMADTVSAERLSIHLREKGALVERYRETGVTYHRLAPILAPTYVSGYGMEMKAGLLRFAAHKGAAERYYPTPPLEPVLQRVLGFDLALRDGNAREATRGLIGAALDRPGTLDPAVLKIVEDFFEDIHSRRDPPEEDALLALRVLGDLRVPTPCQAAAPIRKFATAGGALTPRFAEALFRRLATARPAEKENHPTYLGYTLDYLAQAIAALPDDAIRPYRDRLERLARDPEVRVAGYRALIRLSVFGADAVSTLIYLIDDAARYKSEKDWGSAWQHPYLAGLIGLCRTGPAGKAAIPALYQRLDAGVMVRHGSYWDLTINTLASLGAKADEMWAHLQTDDKNHTRERFDREMQRASREIDCSY